MNFDLNIDTVARHLVVHVPELQDHYAREIQAFGEIANYTFFAAILEKFLLEQVRALQSRKLETAAFQDLLNRLFDFIEVCAIAARDDNDLRELMLAGFIEQIAWNETLYPLVVSQAHPHTRQLINTFNGRP